MKNKTVAHYFESAKRLPVSVSMADVRLMVSTHVIPPKTTKWWNFNNFLIMTATISIISAIVMMTISNEAKEIKYNYEPVIIEDYLEVCRESTITENYFEFAMALGCGKKKKRC